MDRAVPAAASKAGDLAGQLVTSDRGIAAARVQRRFRPAEHRAPAGQRGLVVKVQTEASVEQFTSRLRPRGTGSTDLTADNLG